MLALVLLFAVTFYVCSDDESDDFVEYDVVIAVAASTILYFAIHLIELLRIECLLFALSAFVDNLHYCVCYGCCNNNFGFCCNY